MSRHRLDALLTQSPDVRIVPFADLPVPAQLALAWFMAIDGSAWSCEIDMSDLHDMTTQELKDRLRERLPLFVSRFANEPFGIGMLSREALQKTIMQDPEIADSFSSWNEYHQWYLQGGLEEHSLSDRWPVILSDDDEETLYDGWHRLHDYMRAGATDIPFVYFPKISETMSPEQYAEFSTGLVEDLMQLYKERNINP